MTPDLNCREFVDFLDDYLAGALSYEQRAAFNAHLAICPPCVAYMKTYQASVHMGKAVLKRSEDPVPNEVPEDLVRAVVAARDRS